MAETSKTVSDDKVAYVYLFRPKKIGSLASSTSRSLFGSSTTSNMVNDDSKCQQEEYHLRQICEPRSSICHRYPIDGTIINKWEVKPKELELRYVQILNKLRHAPGIKLLDTFKGYFMATESDIIKAMETAIHNLKAKIETSSVPKTVLRVNTTASNSVSSPFTSNNSNNIYTTSSVKTSDKPSITVTKKLNLENNNSSIDNQNMGRQSSMLSYVTDTISGSRHVNLKKIKRITDSQPPQTFSNVDQFINEMHTFITQRFPQLDPVNVTEFLLHLKSDSSYWNCSMCFKQLISYDQSSGSVQIKANTNVDAILNPTSLQPTSIKGLICSVCHHDLHEISVRLPLNPTWQDLIDALPASVRRYNQVNPIERAYHYTLNGVSHIVTTAAATTMCSNTPIVFPMDCGTDSAV